MASGLVAFLHGRRIRQCAARPLPALPAPLPPRRLEQVRPWPGLTPAIGRIVRATRATVADVRNDLFFAGFAATGGLRGGWYAPKYTTSLVLDLHRVAVTAGLRVSGRVPLAGQAVVRVRAGRSTGTLTLGKRLITGRIGRARVRAVIVP